jgi:hypothetical protein
MVKFWVYRSGSDVVITRTEAGIDESIRFPYRVFKEIVEEVKEYPDVAGYPIELEVSTGAVEVPYEEFFKLASALESN